MSEQRQGDILARPTGWPLRWEQLRTLSVLTFFFWSTLLFIPAVLAFLLLDEPVARLFLPLQETTFRARVSELSALGDSKWYLGLGAAFYVVLRWRYKLFASRAGYLFASVAVTGLASTAAKCFFGRPRPRTFLAEGSDAFHWFTSDWRFWSMPSGHATTLAAVAVAVAIMHPRVRIPVLVAGVAIAFGRIITLDHYVSDVLAGLWLGTTGALVISRCFALRPKTD